MLEEKSLVTVELSKSNKSSNTFLVAKSLEEETLLTHPLLPENVVLRHKTEDLNKVQATLKDSTERSLQFALRNKEFLDYNTLADLKALSLYFVVNRTLTTRQKSNLSHTCGYIASIIMHEEVQEAMKIIKDNEGVLDSFNLMWFNNFKDLFSGEQRITSKKQRASIFNIAGFVLAELETYSSLK